ncbi:transposase [Enterococcus casseliflavus]
MSCVPCIKKVYTAALIAEIGQIKQFENQSKFAKYTVLI